MSQDTYDWIFHYDLSKPVYCKESVDDNNIKFVKEGDNLKGFNVIIDNQTEAKARETCGLKAKNLERILTILSAMELDARLTNVRVPNKPGLKRVTNSLILRSNIEGGIDRIDVTDPNIRNLINQDIDPELSYLNNAVAHKYHGRYSDAIKEAFRIVDEEKSVKQYSKSVVDYNKYLCIRNILAHREGQQLRQGTIDDFIKYFSPVRDAFDFRHYDGNNRIVILESVSTKTQQTLERVAKDLISEVRNILKL